MQIKLLRTFTLIIAFMCLFYCACLSEAEQNSSNSVNTSITSASITSDKLADMFISLNSQKHKSADIYYQMCNIAETLGERGELIKKGIDVVLGFYGLDYNLAVKDSLYKYEGLRDVDFIEDDKLNLAPCYFTAAYQNELAINGITSESDIVVYSRNRMQELVDTHGLTPVALP